MSDAGGGLLYLVAVFVAVAAGWVDRPTGHTIDPERLFKLVLATGLRGRFDAAGADAASWVEAVGRFVPFHPAGRGAIDKVLRPTAWAPSGAPLPGERALVDALAALPDLPSRWQRLYDAPEARETLLDDPSELGATAAPSAWLGGRTTWDDLAIWVSSGEGGVAAALDRKVDRFVLLDGDPGRPDLVGALATVWGPRVVSRVPAAPQFDPWKEAVGRAIDQAAPANADRFVVVAADVAVHPLLAALAERPDARDRLAAVLTLHPALEGRPGADGPLGVAACADRVAGLFRHGVLDVERLVPRPWCSVAWLDRSFDPPAVGGVAVAGWPEPADEGGLEVAIRRVDLGLLPVDAPLDLVARALWVAVAAWSVR